MSSPTRTTRMDTKTITSIAMLTGIAYVVMLVYYGRAAWAYDKRNPYQQD